MIYSTSLTLSIDNVLITAFYLFVLKMIGFWDRVFFEKIEAIYNSDYDFSKQELKEFAFEYQRAEYRLTINQRKKWVYLSFYFITTIFVNTG
jgi:hypothetical protein